MLLKYFKADIVAHKNKENYSPYKVRKALQGTDLKDKKVIDQQKGIHKKPDQIFSAAEANDRMMDIFKNHHFVCSHAERQKLAEFYCLLMQNQEHKNFTRILKIKDIAIKHFSDYHAINKKIGRASCRERG